MVMGRVLWRLLELRALLSKPRDNGKTFRPFSKAKQYQSIEWER
jgi:hypothetical protein